MDDSEKLLEKLEAEDEISQYRDIFYFPESKNGNCVYLNGNSLGLQPVNAEEYVQKELNDWKRYAVEGHFLSESPWLPYDKPIANMMAKIVGALEEEVVVMNTLTTNLHLMLVSFYQPTPDRYKILMEYSPFPSDRYAVISQIRYHGYSPEDALIILEADETEYVSIDSIKQVLHEQGDKIALILIGGVNYYTGQVYRMKEITELGHSYGCFVGFDLAHGAGNVELHLHDWRVDFAVWCTYKYLNAGPGAIAGAFVHQIHFDKQLPRFNGWWGHDEETRFLMGPDFLPSKGADAWRLSNPPILSLAPIKASLEIFLDIGMSALVGKARKMIKYCRYLLGFLGDKVNIITTNREHEFGGQLSIEIKSNGKGVHQQLMNNGIYCDWREPNVIRISFAPVYNSFSDVYKFYNILKLILD